MFDLNDFNDETKDEFFKILEEDIKIDFEEKFGIVK